MKMLTKFLVSIAIFFSVCLACTRCAITSTPVNVAVNEGTKNVTLNCTTDEGSVDWFSVPFASRDGNVFNRLTDAGQLVHPFNASYAVARSSPDAFNLVLLTATAAPSMEGVESYSTAGIYQCLTALRNAVASQVIVVQSGPKCESQSGNGSTQLKCSVVYAAVRPQGVFTYSIDAVLNWTINGAPATDAVYTIDSSSTTGSTATSVVTRDVSQASSGDDFYECIASFGAPVNDPPPQFASNAPYYEERCSIYSSSTAAATATTTATTTPPAITTAAATTSTAANTTIPTITTTSTTTTTTSAEKDSQQSLSLAIIILASVLSEVVGVSVLVCFTFYFRFHCTIVQKNSQRIVDKM